MNIGKLIAQKRHEKGISQLNLSCKTGVEKKTIHRIETEKSDPKLSTIKKLLKGLSLELEVFDEQS